DRVTDARGLELASYAYEGGHLVAARDASGHEERFDHDADGRLVGWRDPRGHRFVWRYDGEGRCVHTSGQGGEWACDLAYGKNETRVTHASGLVETIRYDAYGTVLHVARSDGAFLIREQDETLRVVRERDAAGRVTDLVYDADGGLAFRRDRFGNVLPPEPSPRDLSPRARVLPETHAARLGVPTEGAAPLAIAPSLAALAAWALPTPRAPRAPTLERDACARVVRAIDAEGRATTLARDASGNVVSIVDRDRRETRTEIDGWKLPTRAIDPIGRRVEWSYTATEEVRTYRDPRGVLTEYGRDAADRMISVTRGGRLRASYTWDAGDRLVEKRDGQGALVLRVSPRANALPGRIALTEGGTIELDYDARGRVARAKLGEHDARLERDDDGTILFDRIGARGLRRWRLGAREVTSLFERFETEISREGERVIVRGPTGALSSFALGGGRFARRLANGTEDVLAIDAEGRLEGRLAHRRDRDGALSSWAVRYERSGEGDVLSVWDTARGERRFEIDAAHRLEAEHDEQGTRHVFTHDEADDLLAIGGRSLAYHVGLLVRAGHETLTHDARDRLSVREDERARRTRYAYDDLDQLVRVDLPDGRIWRGSYDGLGRLRRFGIEGAEKELFWDGDRLAAEVGAEGALRVHLYSDARALIPFGFVDYESEHAAPESGKAYYVFHDASGMPTQIEDAEGRIVWWADRVDPYGAITLHAGAEIDYALRWPGHVFDRALGLHHNRFRAYDPGLGRYLQPDPLGHAGSPHSLYAYAPNPLVDVDVLGLTCDPSPIHEGEEPHEGHPLHEDAPGTRRNVIGRLIDAITGRYVDDPRAAGDRRPNVRRTRTEITDGHEARLDPAREPVRGLLARRRAALDEARAARTRGDEASERSAMARARRASEDLGDAAADAEVRRRFPEAELLYAGRGPGTFDRVYDLGGGPPRRTLVVEAKGGGARETSARAFGGDLVEQGTPEYRGATALEMNRVGSATGNDRMRDAGRAVLTSGDDTYYLAVSQPLDSHGDLAAIRVYGYGASVRTGAAPGAPRGPPSSHP
ncbi:MAG: RHS repeat-associated core domain-containing protein, partial [Sandaracinus sp.]